MKENWKVRETLAKIGTLAGVGEDWYEIGEAEYDNVADGNVRYGIYAKTDEMADKVGEVFDKLMAERKTDPQTETEIAKAIVHKMIDDAVIAEDAYPDLRQKMHDAVDEYEPQTERYCTNCKHNGVVVDYECRECHGMDNHEFIEPQTERSE